MLLKKLSLINYRNYAEAELVFDEKIVCFLGENGAGKTNLLDAVHYLSFCKSYFNPIDSQNIQFDQPFFVIQGTFDVDGKQEKIYCGVKRGQKKQFKRNGKEYERLADHIGLFPVVIVTPQDGILITEGSEQRRKFVDSIISQYDKNYLNDLIQYNKALRQRNALLKHLAKERKSDPLALEVWDVQMEETGSRIHEARKKFQENFKPVFSKLYEEVSGGREEVDLVYDSRLGEKPMKELLLDALPKDMAVRHSTVGIHRDDWNMLIHGQPIKRFGSQGQQKSFLIAMKLAQYEYLKDILGRVPILLLDDLFDKLDDRRVEHLLTLVMQPGFSQVFITDTSLKKVPDILKNRNADFRVFHVEQGNATEYET